MTNKNAPELRFEGFEDAWEQRKLGNITKKIGSGKTPKGGNATYLNHGIRLIRSQNIFENSVHFDDIAFISNEVDKEMKNSRVQKNDLLLNITGASIGRSAVYQRSEKANVNQHVCIIRSKNEYDPKFIQLNISSQKGQKEIKLNQAGGGREGLNFQQISKMIFAYPSYQEQKLVSLFFQKIENTIALHQRKLEQLKTLKQGYLQQLFPQKSEKVPRVRFANFESDWEERKLGSIYDFFKGKGLPLDSFQEDGMPAIAYGHLYTQYSEVITLVKFKSKDKGRLSRKGDILFPGSSTVPNGTCQANALMLDDVEVGGDVIIARAREKQPYAPFVSYMINSRRDKLIPIATGTTITHMYGKDIEKLLYCFPRINEQQKIGNFLRQLDDLINSNQLKLEKLKTLKKSYLQKMFI